MHDHTTCVAMGFDFHIDTSIWGSRFSQGGTHVRCTCGQPSWSTISKLFWALFRWIASILVYSIEKPLVPASTWVVLLNSPNPFLFWGFCDPTAGGNRFQIWNTWIPVLSSKPSQIILVTNKNLESGTCWVYKNIASGINFAITRILQERSRE